MLRSRRERRTIFEGGGYRALLVRGSQRDHVFAFARVASDGHAIVVVPRLPASRDGARDDTPIELPFPPRSYHHVLTGPSVASPARAIADVLGDFPITVLDAP